jgi:hypothetical protein
VTIDARHFKDAFLFVKLRALGEADVALRRGGVGHDDFLDKFNRAFLFARVKKIERADVAEGADGLNLKFELVLVNLSPKALFPSP